MQSQWSFSGQWPYVQGSGIGPTLYSVMNRDVLKSR